MAIFSAMMGLRPQKGSKGPLTDEQIKAMEEFAAQGNGFSHTVAGRMAAKAREEAAAQPSDGLEPPAPPRVDRGAMQLQAAGAARRQRRRAAAGTAVRVPGSVLGGGIGTNANLQGKTLLGY